MNSNNYNDSLISELRNLTASDNVCTTELLLVCNQVKSEVFGMVSQGGDLSGSLRYTMHLRNELICKKEVRSKKK